MTQPRVAPFPLLMAIHFGLSGLCLELFCREADSVLIRDGVPEKQVNYDLLSFLIFFASLALVVYALGAITHHAGWLRWSPANPRQNVGTASGWLGLKLRWLGRKLADPSQEL